METERAKQLVDIAQEVSKLFQEAMNKLPYGANVIDELHAGENAHSRILRMLLQYSGGGNFPIYSSFINLLRHNCQEMPDKITCQKPEFVNEEGRIDLLIKEYSIDNRFAIIVENKVCGATDQDEQIQRYIEKVEQDNVPKERIIAIYLTLDGGKEVSEYSLTESAKQKLGVTNDSQGRFIRLNYKYHILPWLQNEVFPNIAIKEDILISSIRLYIDYLRGICSEREYEKPVYDIITSKMKEALGIDTIGKCVSIYKEVESLHDKMTKLLVDEAKDIMKNCFYEPVEVFFKEKYSDLSIEFRDMGNDTRTFWFDVIIQNWEKTKIRFTSDNSGQYFGICYLNPDKKIDSSVSEMLKLKFSYGKTSHWWPWYGMLKKKIQNSDSLEIWKSVENGEFKRFFEEWFEDVMDVSKNLKM